MRLTRKKRKDENSIVSILILGLVVLTISVLVCLWHVFDVQKCFEKQVKDQISSDVQNFSEIMQESTGQSLYTLKQAATVWESADRTRFDDGIFAFLKAYQELEDFEAIYYIMYDSGAVYSADKRLRNMKQTEMLGSVKVSTPKIGISGSKSGAENENEIYYLVPIHHNGKIIGCLAGVQRAEHLLDSVVYGDAAKKGDLFLVNADGQIFCQKAHLFPDMTEEENKNKMPNLFSRMMENSVDSYSRETIHGIERKRKKPDYIKAHIVDRKGMTDYIEMCAIDNIRDTYLVYMYQETVYTDTIQPVVFKSLLVSMLIVLLAIGMLLFVWAKNAKANQLISSLAYDDVITGGKNGNYFKDVAAKVIWQNDSIPYVVVRFDIVNFRYINEAYGHAKADELLRAVVQESAKIFHNKEICTRMNADQFILLAKNDQSFETKCEKLIEILNEKARIIGIKFPIRLKRGVYQVRKEDTDIGVIIDRANAARKTLVGDEKVLTVVYSDKIVDKMYRSDRIESEMEAAMRNGEFRVFIQPKWDIVHDRIYGGEALVRWFREDGSFVFPDEFIPIFEKNGFVERLDIYMLEEVCKKLRYLIDQGREIYPISVNQSRILMHNPEYISQVAKILRRYRIPNGFIELEVTETVFLDNRSMMISIMKQLKDMEITLSMDDFGSGYSSLNMLKDFPFDVIKIDREFFGESVTSHSCVLILQKIIEMADSLGIRVICEGVETQEQIELLRKLGCRYVQGYYYAKPMPIDEYCTEYCHEIENGKEFYDNLFTKEAIAREERSMIEAEAVHAQSASSAVEKFKKTYVARPEDEKKRDEKNPNRKMLSVEEQKALAQMEREKRKAKQRVLDSSMEEDKKKQSAAGKSDMNQAEHAGEAMSEDKNKIVKKESDDSGETKLSEGTGEDA